MSLSKQIKDSMVESINDKIADIADLVGEKGEIVSDRMKTLGFSEYVELMKAVKNTDEETARDILGLGLEEGTMVGGVVKYDGQSEEEYAKAIKLYNEFMSKPRPANEETSDMIMSFIFDDELLDDMYDAQKAGDADVRPMVLKRMSELGLNEANEVNEYVRDSSEQGFGGQERNFIHDLCMMYDGVKRDPAGLKYLGTSEMWDEGNILKDKGKLTTLMLWVKKNKDVVEKRFSRMFGTYSNKDENGKVTASDGNQIIQNIIGKIGAVNESINEEKTLAQNGDYKAVTKDGFVRIMHNDKEIASGDFDSGADGWFLSWGDMKGQKFFGDAQDMVDSFVDNTKYGIVRYPDTAISYIKNDGNGWEHIYDKSYGFKGSVDKADLKYAKKIDKEKIPSRMFKEQYSGGGTVGTLTPGEERASQAQQGQQTNVVGDRNKRSQALQRLGRKNLGGATAQQAADAIDKAMAGQPLTPIQRQAMAHQSQNLDALASNPKTAMQFRNLLNKLNQG
jgi:hypothetical protein